MGLILLMMNHSYEKRYALNNDPLLYKLGVEICPRLLIKNNELLDTELLFIKEKTIVSIPCIHFTFDIEQDPNSGSFKKRILDTFELSQLLSFDDIFFCLKSHVEAIVEHGIENCIIDAFREPHRTTIDHLMASHFLQALAELSIELSTNLMLFLLETYYKIDPERFKKVFLLSRDLVKKIIAENDISLDLMRILANDDDFNDGIIQKIKQNSLSTDQLYFLSTIENSKIRFFLACNESLDEKSIKILCQDSSIIVRTALSERKIIPTQCLRELAHDKHWFVRMILAAREYIPSGVLKILRKDLHVCVRMMIELYQCVDLKSIYTRFYLKIKSLKYDFLWNDLTIRNEMNNYFFGKFYKNLNDFEINFDRDTHSNVKSEFYKRVEAYLKIKKLKESKILEKNI